MTIKLNQNIIKNRCGIASSKRGEAYYRGNKVRLHSGMEGRWTAIVLGAEDFNVTVEANDRGGFTTACTCPSLASVNKDCQHVAAVLYAILGERQTPHRSVNSTALLDNGPLAALFANRTKLPSGRRLHFETREVLNAGFSCRPTILNNGQAMFGVELYVNSIAIGEIRGFLESVEKGTRDTSGLYNPQLHCFEPEIDSVLHQLIRIMEDEKILKGTFTGNGVAGGEAKPELLPIPPASWETLLPLLTAAPRIKLFYGGLEYPGMQLSDGPLPLTIEMKEESGSHKLVVEGLENIVLMEPYRIALAGGKLVHVAEEDCARLAELKRLFVGGGTKELKIPSGQEAYFLEKVIPELRKLGSIRVYETAAGKHAFPPLIAKLYLDRVKNRLLAGLEFHYGKHILNPLETGASAYNPGIHRNTEKEDLILELMEKGSFAKTEGGYFLHNEELEYEFLYHIVPLLEKHVQLFATTAVRNRIFKSPSPPKISVKVKKERTNWLEFTFELAGIAEKEIRDVLAALEEKRKYYRLRNGSLLSLEEREYEEIQRFLKAAPIQNEDFESTLNVPFIQGLRLLDSAGEGTAFSFGDSFRMFLEEIRNPGEMDHPVPGSLKPVLRDYQKQGFQWLKTLASHGFGGILADDMGLGKTLQSIAFIVSELARMKEKGLPALIVCPSSVTYNWLNEFSKFAPEVNAVVADGGVAERASLAADLAGIDVVITSYPLLRKDIGTYERLKFHCVIFDEAQAFKNPVTQTARAVKKIRAVHRFALTGTPIENSIEELWSIFHVVFPELFQGLREYSHLTRKQIARRSRPFMLRRLKKDVLLELPEKIESTDTSEMLPVQKKLYAAYLAKLRVKTFKHLDKETIRKNRIRILAGLTRLRQICCHPALFVDGYKGSSAKFEQLMQIVDESRLAGRRVLIFSQFTKMLGLIGRELANLGISYFYLDGQTPSEERVDICSRFNGGERDFFLISLKAGGTGLNLPGADTVILYDLWWNPAVEEQAADRAHRMGQKNPVHVIKLIAKGTIEEKIHALQEKKRDLVDGIIGTADPSISTLTEEDIREILLMGSD
ncbi:DEAD/DEAH box helicase [Bacillus sp. FJAT-27245]|uniref:DEAD/DEAH box helicase n=1 Tax=Bacillus sp. FJAT-27245 TaxID=1684144 RepID=UPI0006A77810|nr:DEAD/DEAH box helicase [Bacillus sp. FJAT-27245]